MYLDGRFWDFTSDLAKGDTAYTTLALGAHTDNTYFVRLSDQKERSDRIPWFFISRLIPVVYNSSISFHTRMGLVVQLFSLMASMSPPFSRSFIRNHMIYSPASLFLLTQLANQLLCIVHPHLPATLSWGMTPSQGIWLKSDGITMTEAWWTGWGLILLKNGTIWIVPLFVANGK